MEARIAYMIAALLFTLAMLMLILALPVIDGIEEKRGRKKGWMSVASSREFIDLDEEEARP